jgi:hypothetical protein
MTNYDIATHMYIICNMNTCESFQHLFELIQYCSYHVTFTSKGGNFVKKKQKQFLSNSSELLFVVEVGKTRLRGKNALKVFRIN